MITKLDVYIDHHELWESIYFGVKRSNVKATNHKNNAGVGLCTFASAGFAAADDLYNFHTISQTINKNCTDSSCRLNK